MHSTSILIIFGTSLIILYFLSKYKCKKCIEGYRDAIWTQPNKLYQDYYLRSTGSVYGSPYNTPYWDMFNGITYYPHAY